MALAVGICTALACFLMRRSNRQQISQPSVAAPVVLESGIQPTPSRPQTNTMQRPKQEPSTAITTAVTPVVEQKTPAISAVPTGIEYKPVASIVRNEKLLEVISVVSNAVLSVDRILESKNYQFREFSRTVWLVAEDKAQSTVWRIFPYRTNAVVGFVEAIVYQDAAMTQKDPARSFQMSFYPETSALRNFSWGDKHEVLFIQTNGASDYGRDLSGKMGLIMRWDKNGKLTYSNAYDRTRLGKPIGAPQQARKTPYRFGPTSSVEAAKESWRRQQ